MTETKQKRYVGVKETLIYGIANGGQCIGYNMIRAQFNFFLVTVFGVPAKAVALMILVMGIWDAFNDPIMGSLVDRTRTRYGKLRPYLMFVPLPLGIFTILFFAGPVFIGDGTEMQKIIYMCVTYFAWEFFYTIGDIPFWGLSAAISPNPDDRSRAIKSARLISGIIGGIPGLIIIPFVDLSRNGKIPLSMSEVFFILGIVAGTVGMLLFSLSGFCTKERVVQSNDEPKLLDCFRYLFKNRPLLLITLSNIIGTVEGIGGTFTTFFYTMSLGINSLSILAGLPGTLMGWATYPLMTFLEKRWTSRQIVIRVSVFHAFVTVCVFLAGCKFYTNPAIIVPLLALQGVSGSISGSVKAVIPTKMIAETVDYMEHKTGKRNEGMSFSILTFVGKLTASLSSSMAALIMPLVGVAEVGEKMVLVENSGVNTLFWLWGLVTCIPPLLGLFSLIPYFFYDLEGEKLRTIQEENRRRQEAIMKEAE
ncbi:MAG: hypothetical protein E7544_10115 [Ruminococcaceae bacterium]|nr:hypothetical protein [Oscillospiraceae bacterium]